MKLNEIKTVNVGEYNLSEGVIPVHLSMTLDQIIAAGKITNSIQTFTLGGLLSMFKDGGPLRWPRDLNSYAMTTSSDVIDAIKELSGNEAVEMAEWLKQQLIAPVAFETDPQMSPQADIVKWMRYVLKKQD
jgi:hypothetical protein